MKTRRNPYQNDMNRKRLRYQLWSMRKSMVLRAVILLSLGGAFFGLIRMRALARPPVPASVLLWYDYEVVNVYPHDTNAFTQGLFYRDGFLFESTGLRGQSSIRKVRLETGEVVQQRALDSRYFAEGMTDWSNRIVQLTYQSNVGFVYDLDTFDVRDTFTYRGEGWGLTQDGERLIMSDGTSNLRFLDPATMQETRRLTVADRSRPILHLNELEMMRGKLLANVWPSDYIAIIAPDSGQVTGWIDLRGLFPEAGRNKLFHTLNGLAYDTVGDRLFVTGKFWPNVFEIRLRCREREGNVMGQPKQSSQQPPKRDK